MRRLSCLAATLFIAACAGDPAGPAKGLPVGDDPLAIRFGDLDGNAHPYVGLMIAQDASGTPLWRCSGTLISPTVFLTAGHCTDGAAHAEIWFDADVQSGLPGNGYPASGDVGGTPYTHPQWAPNAFYRYDLGVVVLESPVAMGTYGVLPALNVLDALSTQRGRQTASFTAVGYGLQFINPVFVQASLVRMYATPRLVEINTPSVGDFAMIVSANHNTGGICFGDSGGPHFIGTSNVIAGVSSFGNVNCAGYTGTYRVDRADDLTWLATFGVTPP